MAKSQHTTAVEVKITPENQAQIALAVLKRRLGENREAIGYWKARLATKQVMRG